MDLCQCFQCRVWQGAPQSASTASMHGGSRTVSACPGHLQSRRMATPAVSAASAQHDSQATLRHRLQRLRDTPGVLPATPQQAQVVPGAAGCASPLARCLPKMACGPRSAIWICAQSTGSPCRRGRAMTSGGSGRRHSARRGKPSSCRRHHAHPTPPTPRALTCATRIAVESPRRAYGATRGSAPSCSRHRSMRAIGWAGPAAPPAASAPCCRMSAATSGPACCSSLSHSPIRFAATDRCTCHTFRGGRGRGGGRWAAS